LCTDAKVRISEDNTKQKPFFCFSYWAGNKDGIRQKIDRYIANHPLVEMLSLLSRPAPSADCPNGTGRFEPSVSRLTAENSQKQQKLFT